MTAPRRLEIAVKPGAKREEISLDDAGRIVARVRAPAREGKANDALVALIADRLGVPRGAIRILTPTRRLKIIEVPAAADLGRLKGEIRG